MYSNAIALNKISKLLFSKRFAYFKLLKIGEGFRYFLGEILKCYLIISICLNCLAKELILRIKQLKCCLLQLIICLIKVIAKLSLYRFVDVFRSILFFCLSSYLKRIIFSICGLSVFESLVTLVTGTASSKFAARC